MNSIFWALFTLFVLYVLVTHKPLNLRGNKAHMTNRTAWLIYSGLMLYVVGFVFHAI